MNFLLEDLPRIMCPRNAEGDLIMSSAVVVQNNYLD
jgi:hypothetical protein